MFTQLRANLALTLYKASAKTKDMINELLYGLEVFLDVYEVSWDSSKLQMAGVRRIYKPPSLVAVAPTVSRKYAYHRMNRCLWLGSVGSSGHSKPEVAVELLTADVITPMVCTDASPVQPVLKTWLLRDLHRL